MSELFSQAFASEEEVNAILAEEGEDFFELTMEPNQPAYIASRRVLLGPAADITHPEFGRPNNKEETFGLFYRIKVSPKIRYDPFTKEVLQWDAHYVDEYIFNADNNLIDPGDLLY